MSLNSTIAADTLPIITAPGIHASDNTIQPLVPLISEYYNEIITLLNHYGVVLFRGFACQDEDYFSKAIASCHLGSRCDTRDYDLPRTVLNNDIYTSSDLPGHIALPLHHEKPRTLKPPNHIYFCCVTPALKDGGTIFANAESIWSDMPQSIKDKIQKHGVVYQQFFHGNRLNYAWIKRFLGSGCARGWMEYYGMDNKLQIEQQLMREQISWAWVHRKKDLILSMHLPGILTHPITQRVNWFNSAAYLNYYTNFFYGELEKLSAVTYLAARYITWRDMLPMVCHYGNGQPFSASEVAEINRIIQTHVWVHDWLAGDFMIVDNYTYMHGKQPHQGNRLLYSCMTEYSKS